MNNKISSQTERAVGGHPLVRSGHGQKSDDKSKIQAMREVLNLMRRHKALALGGLALFGIMGITALILGFYLGIYLAGELDLTSSGSPRASAVSTPTSPLTQIAKVPTSEATQPPPAAETPSTTLQIIRLH